MPSVSSLVMPHGHNLCVAERSSRPRAGKEPGPRPGRVSGPAPQHLRTARGCSEATQSIHSQVNCKQEAIAGHTPAQGQQRYKEPRTTDHNASSLSDCREKPFRVPSRAAIRYRTITPAARHKPCHVVVRELHCSKMGSMRMLTTSPAPDCRNLAEIDGLGLRTLDYRVVMCDVNARYTLAVGEVCCQGCLLSWVSSGASTRPRTDLDNTVQQHAHYSILRHRGQSRPE